MKLLNKKAYTLAETLLTLAIIGVIAAMTIPTLKNDAEERKFVSLTQKAFNTISDATARLETKHGNSEFWSASKYTEYYKEVINFDTGISVNTELKSSDFSGTEYSLWNSENVFVGTDGMYWKIDTKANNPNFVVDINGPQLPNVIGIDVHAFYLTDDGVVPQGVSGTSNKNPWSACCTAYVIKYGKMPWLKNPIAKCPSI